MKVKAVLWTARMSQNGTAQIMIYVYKNKVKKYYGTGIKVKPENWSETKEKVIGLPQYVKDSYNTAIESKKLSYLEKLSAGIPANQMDEAMEEESASLLTFLKLYIREIKMELHNINPSTAKNYQSVLTRLVQYTGYKGINDLTFDDITMDWYREYYEWSKEMNLGVSSFDKVIKIVKKIMRVAQERSLHNNDIYTHTEFARKRKKKGDKVFLTIQEIEKIEALELDTMEHLARERDRFLISYYFLMRWEDSTLINKESVIENCGLNYTYISSKTGIECTVPISSAAKMLLEYRNYRFDADSNQKANKKIKEICMLAGITQTAKQNGVKAPKYKFVTTHTARRSAATNLYLEGMDLETIARIGGWKKLETLKLYLRASGLEVAQNAKKFKFFR
jgi:site-specific recombinase XerD